MPGRERVTTEDIITEVRELRSLLLPAVTDVAVLRSEHAGYSQRMTERVQGLDDKYEVDLKDIKSTLVDMAKLMHELQSTVSTHSMYASVGKKFIAWSATSLITLVGGMIYAFGHKIIVLFSAR